MRHTTAEFARAVSKAYGSLEGFTATETIRAGAISVTAKIRTRRPDMCAVEFESYVSPLTDIEERLMNGAEYTPEELVGMSLVHDGRETLIYDPKRSIAVRKPSRSLFEPLPGFSALGEIGFLQELTHDFLVRDAGTETIGGRSTRLLGLKPKVPYRSHLLRIVTFPIRRAVVAFDVETKLPVRLRFHPSRDSVLSTFLRSDEPVTIEYTGLTAKPAEPAAFSVSAPSGARLFRETSVPEDQLPERLPFALSLHPLLTKGYQLLDRAGTATVDEEKGRGYCTVLLGAGDEAESARLLTLRVGSFLSRNMSRRKATLSEQGEPTKIGTLDGHVLDRSASWSEELPEQEDRKLFEVTWSNGDLFWFLAGDGVDRSELIDLAIDLAASNAGSPDDPAD